MRDLTESILQLPREKRELLLLQLEKKRRNSGSGLLSFAQQRLWMVYQMHPFDVTNNILSVNEIKGNINIDVLKMAISGVIKRHDILRTRFGQKDGKAYQIVEENLEIPFEYKSLQNISDIDKAQEMAREFIVAQMNVPFVLERLPLIKFFLYHLSEKKYYFVMIIHHIIFDGWSTDVFADELMKYYQCFSTGKPIELSELKLQYRDYAELLYTRDFHKKIKSQMSYWENQLEGAPYSIDLNYDYRKTTERTYKGKQETCIIDANMFRKLKSICIEQNVTMFMFTFSVFALLLNQYSSQDDIIVGVPFAGRTSKDLEPMIGFFVNILVIRAKFCKADESFLDILHQVKKNILNAYENQEISYHKIVEKICKNTSPNDFPYSQVMFIYQNTPACDLNNSEFNIRPIKMDVGISKADLTLELVRRDKYIQVIFEYNTDLYKAGTIKRMITHYMYLLLFLVDNFTCKISEIPLMQKEENEIVAKLLCGKSAKIVDEGIISLFKKNVLHFGNHIALLCNEKRITYRDLDNRSDGVFCYFKKMGIRKGELIGLCLDKSIDFYINLLGILKIGGVYLPLNPDYPEERLGYMIANSNVKVVIIDSDKSQQMRQFDGISYIEPADMQYQGVNVVSCDYEECALEDNFYLMYTSGSSGMPKGVLTSYRNAMNRFQWMWSQYPFLDKEVMAFKSSINFVDSIWEIFGGLLQGRPTVIIQDQNLHNIERFVEQLYNNKVTRLVVVPSLLNEFLNLDDNLIEQLQGISLWTSSGEVLSTLIKNLFYKKFPKSKLLNFYGTTEVMADVTYYETDKNEVNDNVVVPIGKLIQNVKARIVNRFNKQVPIGVKGRLLIEGAAVTKGYYNSDSLNAERFLDNKSVFDTGDEVSLLEDGNMIYHSRTDNQVKIHGVRINLTEIEKIAEQHFAVKKAACVLDDSREKQIILFIMINNSLVKKEAIYDYLTKILPSFMLPSDVVVMDTIFELPNGKVDNKSLLMYRNQCPNISEDKDKSEEETAVEKIWREALGICSVSPNEHFFAIGGNSLKAMKVISAVFSRFGIELLLKEFYENDTIKKMCDFISKKCAICNGERHIRVMEQREFYPLSAAQKRIYITNQIDNHRLKYNLPFFYIIEGKIDTNRLDKAFQVMLNQNEILRTAFSYVQHHIVQKVYQCVENHLIFLQASESDIDTIINNFIDKFDLSKPNLIKLAVVQVEDEKNYLLLDMHHIISDGRSVDIFLKDLLNIYMGRSVDENKIQYKDYANWQYNSLNSGKMQQSRSYWINKLSEISGNMYLPIDRNSSDDSIEKGGMYFYKMDRNISAGVRQFEVQTGISNFMLFTAALGVVLRAYGNKEDIIIGAPIDIREQYETEDMIGNFTNILPIKIRFDLSDIIYEMLLKLRDGVLSDFDHKDYPYEEIIRELDLSGKQKINSLFNVMLTVHNNKIIIDNVGDFKFKEYYYDYYGSAKYDLTFNIVDMSDCIKIYVEYRDGIFLKDTVERIVSHLVSALSFIIHNPLAKIQDIDILTGPEYKTVVYDFNQTVQAYDVNITYPILFERTALKYPNHIAIIDRGGCVSYSELLASVNTIAKNLRKRGIAENSIIAICIERNRKLLEVILGTMGAGASYIPIDLDYPIERISYILKDSKADAVIIEDDGRLKTIFDGEMLLLNTLYDSNDMDLLHNNNVSTDPAYIIYTSGTTGSPKGVVISHRALHNFVRGITRVIDFSPERRMLCCTTVSFDIFALESFVPLCSGGTVVLADRSQQTHVKDLNRLISDHNVDMLQIVPTRLQAILNEVKRTNKNIFKEIKAIMIGGEAFNKKIVDDLKEFYKGKIYNMYGPTETTIWSSVKDITVSEDIVLGGPIANTQIYILNEFMKPVTFGVEGNIYIGGDGLANGYLFNDELTKERFIRSPFLTNRMIYRTGDIGKWRRNGDIEFLGRSDFQVKVGGYRIECGEIENWIIKFSGISQSVVAKIGNFNEAILCGYYVAEREIDEDELKEYLFNMLPQYMVPNIFVKLSELPLTPNGKVDRKALPLPTHVTVTNQFIPPENEIEKEISAIWRDLLSVERVSMSDNFFSLGGTSLLLIEMHSQLTELYPDSVEIFELFAHPNVRKIAQLIYSKQVSKIEIPILLFDKSFYEAVSGQGSELLSFEIEDWEIGSLKNLTSSMGCGRGDIYKAILTYLLMTLATNEVAGITIINEEQMVVCIEREVSRSQKHEAKKFLLDFIGEVHNTKLQHKLGFFEESIGNTIFRQEGTKIVCISEESDMNRQFIRTMFDIVIQITLYKDCCRIVCQYDTSKLNINAVRQFFSQYYDAIISLMEEI